MPNELIATYKTGKTRLVVAVDMHIYKTDLTLKQTDLKDCK